MSKVILLTYDYELFFLQSGTVKKCILDPVEELIRKFDQYNMKATFFVDVLYLRFLLEHKQDFLDDYKQIELQLKTLVSKGHRIELHLHPHWLDTKYENGQIIPCYDRYKLQDLSERDVIDLFKWGKNFLENIARMVDSEYEIVAYRAGGWCLQPFFKIGAGFDIVDIKIDSSVAHGMYDKTKTHSYNFKKSPQCVWYKFQDDPLKVEDNGRFLEIPISTYKTNPWRKIEKRIKYYKNKKTIKIYGDGCGMKVSKWTLLRKLWDKYTMFTMDGVFDEAIALKELKQYPHDVVTYISHPKNLTTISFDFLDRLAEENYKMMSIYDFYNINMKNELVEHL